MGVAADGVFDLGAFFKEGGDSVVGGDGVVWEERGGSATAVGSDFGVGADDESLCQTVSDYPVQGLDNRLTDLFFFNGNTLPSFFNRTIEFAEIFFSRAAVSGVSRVPSSAFAGIPAAAHRLTRFRTSLAR